MEEGQENGWVMGDLRQKIYSVNKIDFWKIKRICPFVKDVCYMTVRAIWRRWIMLINKRWGSGNDLTTQEVTHFWRGVLRKRRKKQINKNTGIQWNFVPLASFQYSFTSHMPSCTSRLLAKKKILSFSFKYLSDKRQILSIF